MILQSVMNIYSFSYPFDVDTYLSLQEIIPHTEKVEMTITYVNLKKTIQLIFERQKLVKKIIIELGRDGYYTIISFDYDSIGKLKSGVEKLAGGDVNATPTILTNMKYSYDEHGKLVQSQQTNPMNIVHSKTFGYFEYQNGKPTVIEEWHGKDLFRTYYYKNNRLIKIENENWGNPKLTWNNDTLEIISYNDNTRTIYCEESFEFESQRLIRWKKKLKKSFQIFEFIYASDGLIETVVKNKKTWVKIDYT